MKKIIFIVVACLTFSNLSRAYSEPADSIRERMAQLEGGELLQAHSNLCRLAAAGHDADYELSCISDFLQEALRQHDADAEGLARSSRIYCYYNYSMGDSLLAAVPSTLKALEANKTWDYYYNVWSALVDHYIYNMKLQTALHEARLMYYDARKREVNYGLGVASFCIGEIYQAMGRPESAENSLRESISALQQEEDITLLLSAYNALGESLANQQKFEELQKVADTWKLVLDTYKSAAMAAGYTPSLNGRYMYCMLAAASSEIGLRNLGEARRLLDSASVYVQGRKPAAQVKYLQVCSDLYAAEGDYANAIGCNARNMEILREAQDSVSLLSVAKKQAGLFLLAGRYEESAELYHRLLPFHEKMRDSRHSHQIDELSTIYEVDNLVLQNKNTRNHYYLAVLFSLLLLMVACSYIVYSGRLKKKNQVLYDTIQQSARMEETPVALKAPVVNPKETLLFNDLCTKMSANKWFRDPELKRDSLAEKMATNRTYLAQAIKNNTDGLSVAEFINSYRLKYAATLLSDMPDVNINEVENLSGFNSRSTFTRLFKEHFGMSPSEYRNISKERLLMKGHRDE